MTPPVQAMAVVLPAHNEESLLGACLTSVRRAVERTAVPTVVVVVLDRCVDTSVLVARSHAEGMRLLVVEGTFSCVGAAREAGVVRASLHLSRVPANRVWVAHTDADSTVPEHWLERQRLLADAGADLVLGTVEPGTAPPGHDPALEVWRQRHTLAEGHDHIYGANLGVRLSESLRVGGFGDVPVGEDVSLARRVQASSLRWVATDTTRVTTSPRRDGRLPQGGFAAYLRELDEALHTNGLGDPQKAGPVSVEDDPAPVGQHVVLHAPAHRL